VRKVMVNSQRMRWRRRTVVEHTVADVPDRPLVPATVAVDHEGIWQDLAGLPPRMRAVLVLRYWEDLSERETADVLGCSIGTVKSQTSRGLARLRASLPSASSATDVDLIYGGKPC